MNSKKTDLITDVASYYSQKIAQYGTTPRGVDWNTKEGQSLRFEQLCKIIDRRLPSFSINDLGCGYGALLDYLTDGHPIFSYTGFDVSVDMLNIATERNIVSESAQFLLSSEPSRPADYGVASGIFNVRLEREDSEWYEYLVTTLDALNRTSRLGFSFNCLTSYSDSDKKRDNLFYADPCHLFDLCKRRYSSDVALLHDYGMYEFTLLVRKK